jgi:subfamily B ATP-binding cassette protein HlyB/CyaB
MLSVAEFGKRFAGEIILAKPMVKALADPDAPRAHRAFGFRWFIPELLKHKKIWRDVLLASLVIQLVALATPVFTQVVIDKVVVHHTMNTLLVIGIALGVFMIFSAALTWVRQSDRDRGARRGIVRWAEAATRDCTRLIEAAEDFDLR